MGSIDLEIHAIAAVCENNLYFNKGLFCAAFSIP